ncbi:TPA: YadA family autotransporter adhesin, partial [Escherichia coli]
SLNQRRITNVAPGVNRSDAVTVGQLNESFSSLKQYTDRKVDSLDKKMGDMKTKLTAGIATSMALSGIPQAYQPDSSLVGVSAGTYGGESAIAVGVSHISQNGHWITKLHAGGNTQNDFGASVGVGYQW